jgi:hypothetical protein
MPARRRKATGNRRPGFGARYEEIADARHFPNVNPDIFNRIMMEWLSTQR